MYVAVIGYETQEGDIDITVLSTIYPGDLEALRAARAYLAERMQFPEVPALGKIIDEEAEREGDYTTWKVHSSSDLALTWGGACTIAVRKVHLEK